MPRFVSQGSFRHIARSWVSLVWIGAFVTMRRLAGRPQVPQWPRDMEISNRFWRGQFSHALAKRDMREGRAYFDSLQTYADETYAVTKIPSKPGEPKGDWFIPRDVKTQTTMLYLHGGGYTFYPAVTRSFAFRVSRTRCGRACPAVR